ncbi:MAG: choice-of-anchor J domain-containing protein [Muribaculaceae bacterium]|nr:choice-of-anchor J domain-containing protein [Muribaculaceae bacterium]
MKHWHTTLAATALGSAAIALTAIAATTDTARTPDMSELARQRAERRQNTTPPAKHAPLRIMGGADGTKPLYGMNLDDYDSYIYSYDGPLVNYSGPAQIKANGQHVKLSNTQIRTQAGCYYEGTFISIFRNWSSNLVEYAFYDPETWQTVGNQINYTFSSDNVFPSDVTYDPTTKRLYGCFLENTGTGFDIGTNFGYIDLTPELENWDEPVKVIKDIGLKMHGMASTVDGTIYGIGVDKKLYQINKINGSLTEIGTIDFKKSPSSFYLGYDSAEIDYDTNQIYFSYIDDECDSFIVKIDPATAKSELVADYGYWSGGTGSCDPFPSIFFKQTAAPANGTPSKVNGLEIKPSGTDLAADLTFTMPALDTDGGELSGDITWNVAVGETIVGTGTAAPDMEVKAHVEVAERGLTTFVVYASAGENEGTPEAKTIFIGNDTPVIPSSPMVATDGKNVQILWDAAEPEHEGGQMAPPTYMVVRHPDNHLVAEATPDTRINDVLESEYKTCYTYSITPSSGGFTGESQSSRPFYGGEIFALPHTDSFTDEILFRQYPAIDANGDYNTWWIDTNRGAAVYSSGSTTADDYLCIGPFEMTAGSKYNFEMTADGHSVPESVAVSVGTDKADSSTFDLEIIPQTTLSPQLGAMRLNGSFIPEESGRYYFGIHALSPGGRQNIYIYDINVTETGSGAPAAPAGLTATATSLEEMTLKCTLPEKTLGGEKANLTSVAIYRDNVLLEEVTEGVSDGAEFIWKDTNVASGGSHKYNVSAVNAAGVGDPASCSGWWGIDRPAMPTNFRVYEDLETPGLVHATWDVPTQGINGGYIDPSAIEWSLDWLSLGPAGSGEKYTMNNSYDVQFPEAAVAEQDIVAFSLYGRNYAGISDRDGKVTRSTYIGPALTLPMRESWKGFTYKSGIWAGEALKDKEELFESLWDISDGTHSGLTSQNDNCMYALSTSVDGGGYRARSPRLTIGDEANPTLVFYFMHKPEAADFYVEVAIDDQPMTLFHEINLADKEAGKWHRIEISLEELRNAKYFQFGFVGHALTAANEFCCIDNLSVLDLKANDLTFMDLTGPTKSDVNDSFDIVASIRNSGSASVSGKDYTVRLTAGGETIAEKEGVNLAADQDADIVFEITPTVADPKEMAFSVEIVYAADENQSDNKGGLVEVAIIHNSFPTVRDLSANTENGVTLFWNEPSEDEILPESVTDSFETYQTFSINNLGDWKLYDGDGCPTVVMTTVLGQLDYPNIGAAMAWQVMDPTQANILSAAWYPRNGSQMLVAFQACANGGRDVESNDWLISPELHGCAQRISFVACSGMSAYSPEIVDILYSTSGTDIEDFVKVAENVEIPYNAADWTEFMFDLPEGARHFAIVHKTRGQLALMIDDVTYIPAGAERQALTLTGYNVYRDGVRITDSPISETTYTDNDVVKGQTYKYQVSAMWDKGESPLCEAYSAEAGSGVAGVSGDDIRIRAMAGTVRVTGAEGFGIEIYTTAGMRVASVKAESAVTDIRVAPGTYIVRAGMKTAKVLVR